MKKPLLFVGLDVHAQNITIALAFEGENEARLYGTITHDLHALEKVLARLRKAHPEAQLRVCYEAGPTGFVLARRLAPLKIACAVVAPSLIPKKPGERIKTDRRDALKLARLHRAGELSAIHVPLHPTYTSYGAFRKVAGHARIRVWMLRQFGALPRNGSVLKESLRHPINREPRFPTPLLQGGTLTSLPPCNQTPFHTLSLDNFHTG